MKVTGVTDVGVTRANNEDFFLVSEDQRIFVVADGMGGYNAGEIAAEIASKSVLSQIDEMPSFDFQKDIEKVFKVANDAILNHVKANNDCRGMGTTIVVAYIDGHTLHVANIGDSRCYGILNHQMIQLTKDHSLVAELVKIGSISEEEAERHPDKNIITSALGVEQHYDVHKDFYDISDFQYILLCSDGLTNMVEQDAILSVFENETIENIGQKLVHMANENGGKDNITVVCIEI